MTFDHSVQQFLTDFVASAADQPKVDRRRVDFDNSFSFLSECFPKGLKTRKGQTPVNLFEAIAVGAALALEKVPDLLVPEQQDLGWVFSDQMRRLTTGATNSRARVAGRIELARDGFLGRIT